MLESVIHRLVDTVLAGLAYMKCRRIKTKDILFQNDGN